MISGPALPCPKCRRPLEPISWHSATAGNCRRCSVDFSFVGFPALTATRASITPKAVLEAENATCFFHRENQAETVCGDCGRFLCVVCAVDFSDRRVCPSCMARANSGHIEAIGQRTLFDGIALALAGVPLLIWPITCVTAPVALGFVVVGWRKPRSLVAGGRGKLIFAGVLALAQIVAWIVILFYVSRT